MSARDKILARLREAKPQAITSELPVYPQWEPGGPEQQVAHFIEQLTNSHAEIIQTAVNDLAAQLENIITEKRLKRVATDKDGEFSDQIMALSQKTEAEFVSFNAPFRQWKDELFDAIDAGITHCRAAIAQTGTLVLWPGPTEPRTVSLVPPCHIAIVKRSTLYDTFAQLIAEQNWHDGLPTNIILVSGPSKTADIQQTLAYGAHGPAELVVVLVEDQ